MHSREIAMFAFLFMFMVSVWGVYFKPKKAVFIVVSFLVVIFGLWNINKTFDDAENSTKKIISTTVNAKDEILKNTYRISPFQIITSYTPNINKLQLITNGDKVPIEYRPDKNKIVVPYLKGKSLYSPITFEGIINSKIIFDSSTGTITNTSDVFHTNDEIAFSISIPIQN